ncbi:MAG: LuxR C-terminal-related transcriptional regulator [Streptosporangiaceae bacterium]
MTAHSDQRAAREEPTSFVGRERELFELPEFVRTARALTLCGTGGIGKSRLAVRMLATLSGEFPDGVWFVELGDLQQPDRVVSRVAAALGVVEERGTPILETLAAALAPRRLLLALDNCEHVIDAAARLCQQLLASSPGLRVIATSREPLRVAAEVVYQVPPLSVPPRGLATPGELSGYEAVRLFVDRAATALPGFAIRPGDVAAVVTLCRALDGVPLAIELAAAWVRVLSVAQIAARLADSFELLTAAGRTAPPRQRTLRATIDWSYDLLTSQERLMLRRLSVFAGWSLDMAEEVCADDELPAGDVLGLIAALVDKSLVVVEPEALGQARYRLLDTIREYAAERLAESGESGLRHRRLRDYSLREVEHAMAVGMGIIAAPWSARVDVFRRYDVDAGNALQVLSRCLTDRDAETGLRMCTAIRPCWIVRGSFAEGAEWFDTFLAIDAPGLAAGVRGPALVGRAQLALATDPAGARRWAEQGLALCRAAGSEFWIASALNLLAEVALHTGHTDEAALRAEEALSLARESGDGWNEGYALGSRAAVAGRCGSLREAQEFADASIGVMRAIDQQWGAARALLGLGDLARLRADPGSAGERYLEALAILREIDSRPEIARCLAGLARLALDQRALGPARRHLAESLRLSQSTGSRISVARGMEAFAALAALEGRPDRAVQLVAAAATLRKAAHLPPLSGAKTEQYLAAARDLGGPAIQRLWALGSGMTSEDAVALALDESGAAPDESGSAPDAAGSALSPAEAASGPVTAAALPVAAGVREAAPLPAGLTQRERQIVALIVAGRRNKAIADELVISVATVARHVANILAKLGFSSRAQVAAWAKTAGSAVGQDPAAPASPGPLRPG